MLLNPLWKSFPGAPPHYLSGVVHCGIAQTHKGKIQLQRFDQQLRKICGNRGRLFLGPCLRDSRKRQKIPDRSTQARDVRRVIRRHIRSSLSWVRATRPSLTDFSKKLVGGNEERVLSDFAFCFTRHFTDSLASAS